LQAKNNENTALTAYKVVNDGAIVWGSPILDVSSFSSLSLTLRVATDIRASTCDMKGATVLMSLMVSSDAMRWTTAASQALSCWTTDAQTMTVGESRSKEEEGKKEGGRRKERK
jgi:hypothetical protein